MDKSSLLRLLADMVEMQESKNQQLLVSPAILIQLGADKIETPFLISEESLKKARAVEVGAMVCRPGPDDNGMEVAIIIGEEEDIKKQAKDWQKIRMDELSPSSKDNDGQD